MDDLAQLVSQVDSATLVDAMGRLHRHRCHILDLVTPTPGRKLFGPAVTISYFPTCHRDFDPDRFNFARMFYEAVADAPVGKVLVLASNGHRDTSLGGGTKLSRAHNHRLAGVLTDGRLRDFDELAEYDCAVYCSGEAVRWGGDVLTPVSADVPVVVAGVGITPGSYIYADHVAVVVLPVGDVRKVLEIALTIREEDERHLVDIRGEGLPHSRPTAVPHVETEPGDRPPRRFSSTR